MFVKLYFTYFTNVGGGAAKYLRFINGTLSNAKCQM